MKKLFILMLVLATGLTPVMATSVKQCMKNSASEFGIKYEVIQAIAYVESRFDNKAIRKNADGSYDACMMQINSNNFRHLRQEFGVSESDIRNNPCTCIRMGTYILRRMGDWAGTGLTGNTIAAYNAGVHPNKINSTGKEYFEKVKYAYRQILWIKQQQEYAKTLEIENSQNAEIAKN